MLFERIAASAARQPADLTAIGQALVDLAGDTEYLDRWVRRLSDAGGSLPIHEARGGPRLSLVRRPEGHLSTVHDHGTWVAISPIAGRELHRRYAIEQGGVDARPVPVDVRTLEAGAVVTLLPPDDVHDHGHMLGQGVPADVLILAGEDQTRFTRTEWDLASGRRRTLRPGDSGRWLATEPMPGA
jgi:predicted metal-dependent enzyme (double-stranded beta helix superfamily)